MPRRKDGQPGQREGMTPAAFGELTRQRILDFIEENTTEEGSPKVQEIAAGLGISRVNVYRQMEKLLAEGRLSRDKGQRTFRVVTGQEGEPPSTIKPRRTSKRQ